jgi:hypothetical protein
MFHSQRRAYLSNPPEFSAKSASTAKVRLIVLSTAALFGIKVYFVPPRTLWKETTVRHAP